MRPIPSARALVSQRISMMPSCASCVTSGGGAAVEITDRKSSWSPRASSSANEVSSRSRRHLCRADGVMGCPPSTADLGAVELKVAASKCSQLLGLSGAGRRNHLDHREHVSAGTLDPEVRRAVDPVVVLNDHMQAGRPGDHASCPSLEVAIWSSSGASPELF